ncbi:MAG: hypothetical protein GF417_01800, partial [Candidatus Latescibacteria bacterium]|nr:hypothetical protein [bacterium]MBD3423161.1 hypothetical protein [Candidatus Latescibacterota bacterium]
FQIRITFACTENSCRSQIAEALAEENYSVLGHEFSSAGTDPAEEVDPGAISMLSELGIDWKGAPKTFAEIATPEVVVTMGCDVQCPFIPGARMIEWEIPDPKGKERDEYLKVRDLIAGKLARLIDEEL